MIVVIADDITGAAELGGIGLRYGLRVLIAENVVARNDIDLLVIYTNTRSMQKAKAVEIMKCLTAKVKALQPALFYKKTDSVLRGHVLAEMEAQMKVYEADKGLLIPMNPSLGRTIKGGQYFVNGDLVHETSFSTDPEFPIRHSRVKQMLGSGEVKVIKNREEMQMAGVFVGEASSMTDIDSWANALDDSTLYAGGASFFDALLRKRFKRKERPDSVEHSSPMLLVSGTTFGKSVKKLQALGDVVSLMPQKLFLSHSILKNEIERWSEDVIQIIAQHKKAVIAIGDKKDTTNSALLRDKMCEVVKRIFEKVSVQELLVEGGSTAYEIAKGLGWQSFIPESELAQGVVRMKVDGTTDVHMTIKPGSYDWPPEWNF